MTENPYQTPQNIDAPSTPPSDAVKVRREHIKTEASIKSVGILYFLGSFALLAAGVVDLAAIADAPTVADLPRYAAAAALIGLGVAQFIVGAAVRKLKPWSRIGIGIMSGLGLLGFPIGTLISAYILTLAFGKKGQMVFSEPYKEIIAATPEVKYKTSTTVWIVLGVILAAIALGILFLLYAG